MTDFAKIMQTDSLHIGYFPGSDKVIFIKTGQGGSIYGYNNMYLNYAVCINRKLGYSVFVSTTVIDTNDSFLADMQAVEECLGTKDFEMYYVGVSKGGLIGIWHGCDDPRIKRMLSINAPLMINYHGKTLPGVKKLGREVLTLIYGSLDPSYPYVPFVEKHSRVEIIDGADHNLYGSALSFFEILERHLLSNEKTQ